MAFCSGSKGEDSEAIGKESSVQGQSRRWCAKRERDCETMSDRSVAVEVSIERYDRELSGNEEIIGNDEVSMEQLKTQVQEVFSTEEQ